MVNWMTYKMTLPELRQRLQHLESQRTNLDREIFQTKREIEKLSPFSKEQKIDVKPNDE